MKTILIALVIFEKQFVGAGCLSAGLDEADVFTDKK
jgi:hypothetical protein